MADTITLEKQLWRMGEEKPLTIEVKRDDIGSFSTATAVIDVYNSAGSLVVTAQSMTVTDRTTYATASYTLTAKSGGNMESAGNYSAFVKITVGSTIRRWLVPIEVASVP